MCNVPGSCDQLRDRRRREHDGALQQLARAIRGRARARGVLLPPSRAPRSSGDAAASNSDGWKLGSSSRMRSMQRRVRREGAWDALGEQEVRNLLRVGVREPRADSERALIFTSAFRSAIRVARELHGRGIRERLAVARHCRLDQAAEEEPIQPSASTHERRHVDHRQLRRRPCGAAAAARGRSAGSCARSSR